MAADSSLVRYHYFIYCPFPTTHNVLPACTKELLCRPRRLSTHETSLLILFHDEEQRSIKNRRSLVAFVHFLCGRCDFEILVLLRKSVTLSTTDDCSFPVSWGNVRAFRPIFQKSVHLGPHFSRQLDIPINTLRPSHCYHRYPPLPPDPRCCWS